MTLNDKPKTEPTAPRLNWRERLSRHRGNWFIALIILVMIYLQLPMLKGLFYRFSGDSVPAAVTWRTDFNAAMNEAKQSGKPLLVDFSASWCPPCRTMKHEVWPDEQVGKVANDSFIPVLVDVDSDSATAERYGISGIPTILVLDTSGGVLQRGGFMSRGEMLGFLKQAAKPK